MSGFDPWRPFNTADAENLTNSLAVRALSDIGDFDLSDGKVIRWNGIDHRWDMVPYSAQEKKQSARVASTGDVDILTELEAGDTINGVILAPGDRVFLTAQTNAVENGIYVVQPIGGAVRSTDLALGDAAGAAIIFVREGAQYADTGWICTNDAGNDIVGTDLLDFQVFAGAGGAGLELRDEGGSIGSNITVLDVVGVDHNVILTAPGVATLYCPSALASSHFNTADGTNDCSVSNITTTSRNVATPTAEGNPYKIGAWVGGTAHACSNSGIWTYSTINQCLFEDLLSTIEVNVYDADGVTPLATHITAAIAGAIDVTVNNIRIRVTSWAVENVKWIGIVTVDITMSAILPPGGRCSVEIIHHNGGTDYTKTQNDIFYDSEPNAATLTGVTIAERIGFVNLKWLSGIPYYTDGSQFEINIADSDYLNADSYPTNQVRIEGDEYHLPALDLTGADLTGWTNAHDNVNASYNKLDWAVLASNFRTVTTTGNVRARWQDWINGGWVNSADASILIDTYGQESTDLAEYFTDEVYRRTGYSGALWDSTQDIGAYAGNTGAQVTEGILRVGGINYTTYMPAGGRDYSAHAAPKDYYRRIIDVAGLVRNSATLSIQGFTLANLVASQVEMWIMIPTRFTSPCYAHTAATYDFATFTGNNDPIRKLSSTANSIDVSFGTLGLTAGQTYFELRIVINDASIQPSSIVVSW